MPNHKSSEKRVRSDERKRVRNKSYMSATRATIRELQSSLADLKGKPEEGRSLLRAAQSRIAKSVSKGLVHKNTASRKISRLAKMVSKATAGEFTPIATRTKTRAKKS